MMESSNRFNKLIQKQYSLYLRGGMFLWLSVILCRMIRWYYHCDIPYSTDVRGVRFMHKGFGVVINPKAKIGDGTVIQHRVTIGEIGSGVPEIGHNCFLGAGSIIIGGITVGDNVKVGAGAVVINDVPNDATVVGVPAKVVSIK